MKKLLLLSFVLLFLGSCEDTKKAPVNSPSKKELDLQQQQKIKDSLAQLNQKKKDTSTSKYPIITQENVVEFLTVYGKDNPETKVRISTIHGDIDIELYRDTPLHRANFIYLVKQKYFNDTFFHRVDPDFIIQ